MNIFFYFFFQLKYYLSREYIFSILLKLIKIFIKNIEEISFNMKQITMKRFAVQVGSVAPVEYF